MKFDFIEDQEERAKVEAAHKTTIDENEDTRMLKEGKFEEVIQKRASAEALRIRQATQSASVYSVYLSAVNSIKNGLLFMRKWAGYNKDDIVIDAPSSLTFGVPDSSIIKEVVEGFGNGIIPLTVIHKYLISSGLLDQTIGFEDYVTLLQSDKVLKKDLEITKDKR